MAQPKKTIPKTDDRHLRLAYMGNTCKICNKSVEEVERQFLTSKGAFEFNHIDPSQKSANYDNLIRQKISEKQLDELDKCNLLCRFCHGIWTNQKVKGKMVITIQLPDKRVVRKQFKYHGLIKNDNDNTVVNVFPDYAPKIDIYSYRLGNGKLVYRIGCELEKVIFKLMFATKRRKLLHIWDNFGLVLRVKKIDDIQFEVMYSVRFLLIKFCGDPENSRDPHIWARNGKAVIERDRVESKGELSFRMNYSDF